MQTEDGYIVRMCLYDDKAAFGLLVDKYKSGIYALAYSKLHNFRDAGNIAQAAFIEAYEGLCTLTRRDSFLALLCSITSNLCRDRIQTQFRYTGCDPAARQTPDVPELDPVNSPRKRILRESLDEVRDLLPEVLYQVVILRYLGGMNTREIARFLGVSSGTISQHLREARVVLGEEVIAMMREAHEQYKLREDFTFYIVEMVKRLSGPSVSRITWLPLGLSLTVGIILLFWESLSL